MTTCDLLVTGAGGFVGRHLVQHATSAGVSVRSVDWDLRDARMTATRIAELAPRMVAHLAAAPRDGSPWAWLADDMRMAGSLLAALDEHAPASPVLMTGSAAQYGMGLERALREGDPLDPVSAYGTVKCVLERAVTAPALRGAVRVIWTRSFNHIGPGQGQDAPAAQWARQVAQAERAVGGTLYAGSTDVVRDFLDARDVAAAYLALLRSGAGGIVNVASGRATRLRTILDLLVEHARVPIALAHDPALRRRLDPPYVVGDPSRLGKLTGWSPAIALERSVGDLLDEWRARVATGDPQAAVEVGR